MEFDRGSRMAQSRRPGQRPRAASMVALTAVGWCAKSSTTNTPPISACTSIRRFTLRNVASALAISSPGMPRLCATISAPMAFSALCRPVAANANSPNNFSRCATRNRMVSPSMVKPLTTQSLPLLNPYVSMGQNAFSAARGHKIDQAAESQLVGLKIRINVRVVVFERGDDQIIGMVVKEFGPAVPERRFILVTLKNELFPAAKPITLSKVFRHAPHQKIRALARGMENPSQHCRRRGFSV